MLPRAGFAVMLLLSFRSSATAHSVMAIALFEILCTWCDAAPAAVNLDRCAPWLVPRGGGRLPWIS
ncbi:hypothetical protein DI396_01805 [Litorivita pollutaquae]|uniref:Secreted protein n=1 Tax=Litorivita pollutaquae TaxID=2200892 RepID=A0A2V4MQ41_9RHOB|nr:hypothetical protein DI396_01805 [Litorivita pollutaquae]